MFIAWPKFRVKSWDTATYGATENRKCRSGNNWKLVSVSKYGPYLVLKIQTSPPICQESRLRVCPETRRAWQFHFYIIYINQPMLLTPVYLHGLQNKLKYTYIYIEQVVLSNHHSPRWNLRPFSGRHVRENRVRLVRGREMFLSFTQLHCSNTRWASSFIKVWCTQSELLHIILTFCFWLLFL